MHWILQENLFKETEWNNLVGTLERFNIPYSVHKVVPFIGDLIPEAPGYMIQQGYPDKIICFGSYALRHIAKKRGWTPGVYDLFDQNFQVQLQHWGENMLNHDSQVLKFKDAVLDNHYFVRPIDDSKYFAGRVFEPEEFNTWRKGICEEGYDWGNSLTPDTLIQISKIKYIAAEYRYWVVDGKIVTKSLYKRGSKVIYSSEVDPLIDMFVETAIGMWNPLDAFVIDVCKTVDREYKIVEINTINSAGFYAADVQKLVMALEEANP